MLEDSGEKIAAAETTQTIFSLRIRLKTWCGAGFGVWLSRLIDSDVGEESGFSS